MRSATSPLPWRKTGADSKLRWVCRRSTFARCTARASCGSPRPTRGAVRRSRPMLPSPPSPASPAPCRWRTACRCCLPHPMVVVSARPMPDGAAWPAACSRPRSRRCALPRRASRRAWSPGSGHASVRVSSRSAPRWSLRSATVRISCRGRAPTARCAGWPICPPSRATDLQAAGVVQISGGAWCTVEDESRFFSFRRDGVTGRMAAAVWLFD